jgi:hypothetical protein
MARGIDRRADQEMIRADVRPRQPRYVRTRSSARSCWTASPLQRQLWRSFPVLFALRIDPPVRLHS